MDGRCGSDEQLCSQCIVVDKVEEQGRMWSRVCVLWVHVIPEDEILKWCDHALVLDRIIFFA